MDLREIRDRALDYWWVVALLVTAGWLLALTLYVHGLGKPAGNVPLIGGDTVKVVPASGVAGFPVDVFCEDPLTEVRYSYIPGVGFSHELLRVRDGVVELVTISTTDTGEALPGEHYIDTAAGQQKEPAVANRRALECIEDKRELRQ